MNQEERIKYLEVKVDLLLTHLELQKKINEKVLESLSDKEEKIEVSGDFSGEIEIANKKIDLLVDTLLDVFSKESVYDKQEGKALLNNVKTFTGDIDGR